MNQDNGIRLLSKYRRELMGFAALWIFLFHEWSPVLHNIPLLGKLEVFAASSGYCGVDIFFFLSGMGLCYAIEKHSVPEFYRRRISRLLIPYLVTAFATMVILGWEPAVFVKHLTGFSFWTTNVYAYGWFFHAIVALYLLFPAYYWGFRRAGTKLRFTLLSLLVWLAATLLLRGTLRPDLYIFTNRIPVFLTGVWIGALIKENTFSSPRFLWAGSILGCLAGFVLIFLTKFCGMSLAIPDSATPNFLVAVFGCLLLAKLLQLCDSALPKVCGAVRKALCFYGEISLEFYFMQEISARVDRTPLEERLGALPCNLLIFVGMTVIAWGLFRGCQSLKGLGKKAPAAH